eukprot:767985-Hanusia_phi.AAC.2
MRPPSIPRSLSGLLEALSETLTGASPGVDPCTAVRLVAQQTIVFTSFQCFCPWTSFPAACVHTCQVHLCTGTRRLTGFVLHGRDLQIARDIFRTQKAVCASIREPSPGEVSDLEGGGERPNRSLKSCLLISGCTC